LYVVFAPRSKNGDPTIQTEVNANSLTEKEVEEEAVVS
jgi:hypothetical protein